MKKQEMLEKFVILLKIRISLFSLRSTECCHEDQIEDDEMGEKFSADEDVTNYLRNFFRGNLQERSHVEEPDVDGKIILKWILKELLAGFVWLSV